MNYEQLGVFYLGREQDPATGTLGEPLLYESRDLVTHALCVGMTGSGKTGLGLALIEEAAIDGVPVLAIDPKGDLTNLLLTFPDLAPADFEPWVNADDAARAGLSTADFAAKEAQRWREGLAQWDQDGERIARLKAAADFTVFTPGSSAGVPVSVLGSFAPPPVDDPELVAERVQTTVSGLLTLAGVDADALTSPAHILLSTILITAWSEGESLDLPALIGRVQQPPMASVGVIEIDEFMPPKERSALALALNALIAAPGFQVWTTGEPLDIGSLLRTADGRPRVSVFTISHLSDDQRMFFVAQLLGALTAWMRAQSGTGSLRALLYMDEIFGYFPPVANPPAKLPLLTLLKQGRAFGIGVVLATQNPVDLDYKGLSNIGTWWLGRLQTDRDKQRLLDGLESAGGGGLQRAEVDRLLSGLTSRVFLMRNVHDEGLTLLRSRWALSYLRGPLGRDDIRRLTARRGEVAVETQAAPPASEVSSPAFPPVAIPAAAKSASTASPLNTNLPQYFAPAASGAILSPWVYGVVDVHVRSARFGVDTTRQLVLETPVTGGAIAVDWGAARESSLEPDDLLAQAPEGATYAAPPSTALSAAAFARWGRQLKSWAAQSQTVTLLRAGSGEVSRPGESQREFIARLTFSAREKRDATLGKLREKFGRQRATLTAKVERAQLAIDRERHEAASQRLDTALSVGATLAGALLGRRTRRRAGAAVRSANRAAKQAQDVAEARKSLAAAQAALAELDARFESEAAALQVKFDAPGIALETVTVKPARDSVDVKLLALLWRPAD